ncbi:subtilisin-like protease SBT5.4 isoform X7 [Lathyrus oleraceus]|uniref:subtilisin-like protease SBT5.4 isoform X7 n=1 Tax=Pisum sativum TaxID=3888 RepID=UPI0021CF7AF7|nr:subtilisin-like protease SBT5.4 isoform X7 [Pisum sativum]
MRETMSSSICHMLISLLLFVSLQHTLAIKQSYIVYLGSHSFGSNPSLLDSESVTNSHYDLLGSYLGSTEKAKEAIFYSYNKYINGFAAILDEDEAKEIAKHPNVVSMFLSKRYELHTTRSWNFLGLETDRGFANVSVWKKSLGEDIIIGNLDTGVWPESKSFSDEGFGPIPKKWKGICQVGKGNPDKFYCNRKLIGAKYFYKGYQEHPGPANVTFNSARDFDGHGTHTLSTAGGNFVAGANVVGFGNGTASGGSPKARVASYKVCWDGCDEADILAGFEAAISDGVDVLSVSLGGIFPQFGSGNAISVGSFHAIANNVIVVASAGNSGPSTSSVVNIEPWTITVAASTIDRDFTSYVILGNKKIYKGASLSELELPPNKSYPLIASDCKEGTLAKQNVKGKIVVCRRGGSARVDMGVQASLAGAIGLILANDRDSGDGVIADPHVLPATNVGFADGNAIFNYIDHRNSPVAYITKVKTELGVKNNPTISSFSSRGPNKFSPTILKPDITAPGVNIIAAYTLANSPTEQPSDKRRIPFVTMSGTSMSCPHVAGVVGLVKSVHPDWSPAAIKSAIMTTATTKNNNGVEILDSSLEKATPFAYGAGHVQPNLAVDPGLVYDLNVTDYLNYLCGREYTSDQLKVFYGKPYTCPKSFSLADFNYPSISIYELDVWKSLNVTRTVTNVGPPSEYRVEIQQPPQFQVTVQPEILRFTHKGEKKEFKVTITMKPNSKYVTDFEFGKLIWTDGKHHVGTPITIKYTDL